MLFEPYFRCNTIAMCVCLFNWFSHETFCFYIWSCLFLYLVLLVSISGLAWIYHELCKRLIAF